jgi:hypothetical protein
VQLRARRRPSWRRSDPLGIDHVGVVVQEAGECQPRPCLVEIAPDPGCGQVHPTQILAEVGPTPRVVAVAHVREPLLRLGIIAQLPVLQIEVCRLVAAKVVEPRFAGHIVVTERTAQIATARSRRLGSSRYRR